MEAELERAGDGVLELWPRDETEDEGDDIGFGCAGFMEVARAILALNYEKNGFL